MKIPYPYIVIEGCIGAGKTTFARMLAADFNARIVLEQFDDNSFLPKFYQEPEKYAFPLELSFLAERYQQLKRILTQTDLFHDITVADYFIQKSLIFARATLPDDEFALYSKLFNIIHPQLPVPDLVVYLYSDTPRLMKNIAQRGRSYEQTISREYLDRIQKGYLEYFRQQPARRILVVDTNHTDFVATPNHYQWLRSLVETNHTEGIHRIVPPWSKG